MVIRSRVLALGAAALVAMLVPAPSAANHPQGTTAMSMTFDHDGDNEWWVEVLTKASVGDAVVAMEARSESGTFHGLQQQAIINGWTKWGPETAFRIPSGERVMFRAHMIDDATGDAAMVESCWFTHPAGVEQCQASGFDATFTGVRGNEWWIQANVGTTGGTLAKVEVKLDGSDWKPLTKQSWGGWAASYHIVQGTVVEVRATSTTGATDSQCHKWIPAPNTDAPVRECLPPPFDAGFSAVKGNEWWVQLKVQPSAGHSNIGVQVRIDGGAWQPLTKQSWGPYDWAGSFHMPQDSRLEFRAQSSLNGATDLSDGCYKWIPPSGQEAMPRDCFPWP